ncbi:hypothetical protein RGUI_3502 [Rhodovulum sp. P5]|uniref:hypothetical protein n=1 Tax=Rhodovulum sp. P5 TaxID=1564506 RepID=UPI0009C285D0|nr:hypothetical protein [Rhodovulum sp. P5]ARE41643.1 hypothetical protein RGUI_3502 [Rhodovulum sp. P5]
MNILIGTVLLWILALVLLRKLWRESPEHLAPLFARTRKTMTFMMPRVVAGLVGAGFMAELLPVDHIDQYFGDAAGFGGVVLATALGAATPGGPFVAFAIGAAALKAGAAWAPLIAYVTSWSVMNLNRTIAYELPLMGRRFVLLRSAVSLPMPLILGGLVLLV